jgi:hypothetical protein
MLEPFAELTTLGKIIAVGLLVLCVSLFLPTTQATLPMVLPYVAAVVGGH